VKEKEDKKEDERKRDCHVKFLLNEKRKCEKNGGFCLRGKVKKNLRER